MTAPPEVGSVWMQTAGKHAGYTVRVVRITGSGSVVLRLVGTAHGKGRGKCSQGKQVIIPAVIFATMYARRGERID